MIEILPLKTAQAIENCQAGATLEGCNLVYLATENEVGIGTAFFGVEPEKITLLKLEPKNIELFLCDSLMRAGFAAAHERGAKTAVIAENVKLPVASLAGQPVTPGAVLELDLLFGAKA